MTPERWKQIKAVLDRALDLNPEQRTAFLDQACDGDQALLQEVESLLAAGEEGRSSFLQSSPVMQLAKGTRLGDYEIHSLLGAGGMGEVFRARDVRLRRDVAVKVLPALLSSNPDRLQRFEQEAMAAAALNHPNILAVYQMGSPLRHLCLRNNSVRDADRVGRNHDGHPERRTLGDFAADTEPFVPAAKSSASLPRKRQRR